MIVYEFKLFDFFFFYFQPLDQSLVHILRSIVWLALCTFCTMMLIDFHYFCFVSCVSLCVCHIIMVEKNKQNCFYNDLHSFFKLPTYLSVYFVSSVFVLLALFVSLLAFSA